MAHMSALETVWLLILRQVMEYISQATRQRKQFFPLMDEVSQRSAARRRLKSICSFRLCQHDCLRMQAGSSAAAYCKRQASTAVGVTSACFLCFPRYLWGKGEKKILIILSHISCQKDKHVETPECQTLWQSYKSVTIKKIQLCFFFFLFNSFCKWLCVLNRGKTNELSSCRTQKSAFSPSVASKCMPLCVLCVQSKYENLLQFHLLILKGMNVDFVYI